jgi:hypothetical protein
LIDGNRRICYHPQYVLKELFLQEALKKGAWNQIINTVPEGLVCLWRLQDVNRYSMGDIARRDRLAGGLSQLKRFSQKYPFLLKKGFSNFTLLFLGVTGTFSSLPPIDTQKVVTSESAAPVQEKDTEAYAKELCLWQKDFSFFNDLDLQKKVVADRLPCQEVKKIAKATPLETSSVPSSQNEPKDESLDQEIREMTAGYPLEVMAPTIAEYDRDVAGLIVGIAKKESNWGKRVPVDANGKDCFNYWGFKGAGSRGVAMGHGCFGSPEEAVHAVGNRIAELVDIKKTSEPKNMIIWKCGSSCATHSPESVRKWISDVDLYYRKIAKN